MLSMVHLEKPKRLLISVKSLYLCHFWIKINAKVFLSSLISGFLTSEWGKETWVVQRRELVIHLPLPVTSLGTSISQATMHMSRGLKSKDFYEKNAIVEALNARQSNKAISMGRAKLRWNLEIEKNVCFFLSLQHSFMCFPLFCSDPFSGSHVVSTEINKLIEEFWVFPWEPFVFWCSWRSFYLLMRKGPAAISFI